MGTRSFVNSVPATAHLPGLEGQALKLALPGTHALLLHQVMSVLLHVVRGVRFEAQIGVSSVALEALFREFDAWVNACEYDSQGVIVIRDAHGDPISKFEKEFEPIEIRALRNSLEVALLDLGQNEFFTITGFSLGEGKQLLDVLNAALLAPLHLDEPTDSVAH